MCTQTRLQYINHTRLTFITQQKTGSVNPLFALPSIIMFRDQ